MSRMKGALLVAALVAAGAGNVTACGYVKGSLSETTNVPARPGAAPQPVVPGFPVKHFVRPGASAMRLPYPTINWPDPQDRLKQRLIHRRITIDRITRMFNALKVVPAGSYACPMDDGSKMVVVFGYRNAHPERVVVKLSGCEWAINGRSSRFMTRRLQNRLLHLVGGRYP